MHIVIPGLVHKILRLSGRQLGRGDEFRQLHNAHISLTGIVDPHKLSWLAWLRWLAKERLRSIYESTYLACLPPYLAL